MPGRKNQSCREFKWGNFYILKIEFGGEKLFDSPTVELPKFSSFRRTVHRDEKIEKREDRKCWHEKSCKEFDGDHFCILNIELGGEFF